MRSKLERNRRELHTDAESKFNLLFYHYEEKRDPLAISAFQGLAPYFITRTNIPEEPMPATFELQLKNYCIQLFEAEAELRLSVPVDAAILREWLQDLAEDIRAELQSRISGKRVDLHRSKEDRAKIVADALEQSVTAFCDRKSGQTTAKTRTSMNQSLTAPNLPQLESGAQAKSVGQIIRSLREEARWTVENLSNETQIPTRTVQRHESGDIKELRPKTIAAYELAFSKKIGRQVILNADSTSS